MELLLDDPREEEIQQPELDTNWEITDQDLVDFFDEFKIDEEDSSEAISVTDEEIDEFLELFAEYKEASEQDSLKEACGIFGGVLPGENITPTVVVGISELQHRGEEGAGLSYDSKKGNIKVIKDHGRIDHALNAQKVKKIKTERAIAHTLYTTVDRSGPEARRAIQPIYIRNEEGKVDFSLVHNGNLVNKVKLAEKYGLNIEDYVSDTDLMAHIIAKVKFEIQLSIPEVLEEVTPDFEGAFSLIIMDDENVYGMRDSMGMRPLLLAYKNDGWLLSSETAAIEQAGGRVSRDVSPGELITIDRRGKKFSRQILKAAPEEKQCIFEFVYFANPMSYINGVSVEEARMNAGEMLAAYEDDDFEIDAVIAIPNSGIAAANGYFNYMNRKNLEHAARTGEIRELERTRGLTKGNLGRSFTAANQIDREYVASRLGVFKKNVDGKKIVAVDDSVVRGTTTSKVVKLLDWAGAKEIHLRVASPTYAHPCNYGINASTYEELLSTNYANPDDQARFIGVESIRFLSLKDLYNATGRHGYCDACLTGEQPWLIEQEVRLRPRRQTT